MSVPQSKLELRLSCQDLPNLDVFSKTDCRVLAYWHDKNSAVMANTKQLDQSKFIGQTETIKDNLNPVFSTALKVDYYFEKEQYILFVLLDIDNEQGKMRQQDFIGTVVSTVGSIAGAKDQKLTKPILKGNAPLQKAKLTIVAEESIESKNVFKWQLTATCPKKGLFGRPDPFFKIYRTREDGTLVAVYTSKVQKNRIDAVWPAQSVPVQDLCNSDTDRALVVKFFDWENSGNHIYMGEFSASVKEMLTDTHKEFPMTKFTYGNSNPDNTLAPRDKKSEKVGSVRVGPSRIEHIHTFFDYLTKGCHLSFSAAIDFTASNGAPTAPNSLHYYPGPGAPLNQYQQAIISVGNIIQEYDTDKSFPVYGFGAKLPTGEVSHCWALNGNPTNPGCLGVQGILDAYLLAVKNVTLYGPTNFSPVITTFSSMVTQELENRKRLGPQQVPWTYHVLLIITDGSITDTDATIRAIIRASSLPCSIIIVGVGSGSDFESMNILDSDNQPLRDDSGKQSERDIVQFVAVNHILQRCAQMNIPFEAELARQVLAELPNQVLEWFQKRGLRPENMI